MKPSVVFGYHYDQNSKFELEVLSNVKSLKSIGASLLANYRFYPDLDVDPVKLYVSGGLGGYLQIVPFGFGGGSTGTPTSKKDVGTKTGKKDVGTQTGKIDVGTQTGEKDVGTQTDKENDTSTTTTVDDTSTTTTVDDTSTTTTAGDGATAGAQAGESVEELKKQVKLLKDAKEAVENMKEIEKLEKQIKELEKLDKEIDEIGNGIGTVNLSLADKILGSISYKLKVGVDYEITPQIVGAVGITMGGQLSGFKPPIKMPDTTFEVGIRYNF